MADDKYPVESDRRRFVKGVVGGAALSGTLTVGAAGVSLATSGAGGGGGSMAYRSATREAGPAPRGLPQIPIELDDEGYIRGIWPEPETEEVDGQELVYSRTEIGGVEYTTEWFQYCGLQTFEGIAPDADGQDAYLRYVETPPPEYEWQQEVDGGGRMHIDDFEDYQDWDNSLGDAGIGKPATGTWRSQNLPPEQTIPILVIRSERIQEEAERQADEGDEWLQESTHEGVVAFVNKCTHFCCVPGFKRYEEAASYDAANKIYCQCHQSVYDPFTIEEERFVALPRPEDG